MDTEARCEVDGVGVADLIHQSWEERPEQLEGSSTKSTGSLFGPPRGDKGASVSGRCSSAAPLRSSWLINQEYCFFSLPLMKLSGLF